ncbi:hypothetical protein [Niabella hirudinis]|uniref:hypothetical protein n=1 Tax=Niabella hirudinis TaxID=1285929 RepID=UPI003EC02EF2
MRVILTVLFLIIGMLPAVAQDRIYSRKERRVIEARITEVDIEFIKYRKLHNPDGPVYKYPIKYVDSIVYANGTADYFSTGRGHRPIGPEKAARQRAYEKLGPHTLIASGGVFDMANTNLEYNAPANMRNRPSAVFQLSYERTVLNNRLGLDVAPFVGVNEGAYGLGLAMRFYPQNRGRVRLGMGPQYIFSSKNIVAYYRVAGANDNGSFPYTTGAYVREQARFSSLAFSGKLTVNVNRILCLAANFSVGGALGGRASDDHHPDQWKLERDNVYYMAGLGAGIRF